MNAEQPINQMSATNPSQVIYSAVAQRVKNSDGGFPHDILLKEFGDEAQDSVYGLYVTGRVGISNDGYVYWK